MTVPPATADARLPALENAIYARLDSLPIRRSAVPEAARDLLRQGGAISSGAAGAFLPSGEGLDAWAARYVLDFPGYGVEVPVAAPVVTKLKVNVAKGATATEKLAAANGDKPVSL